MERGVGIAMSGFRIGTIQGIPIRIHVTFLLALPLLAFGFARAFREAAELAGEDPSALGNPFLWGLTVALALFLSVLLHELAHSLYALRRGGRVRDITLLLIGGVSQISEMPREPRHEAVMALVGPLVSIGLGALLYGLHVLLADTSSFQLRFALFYLAGLNLFLGLFNLLPAYPMDGGRILRALLSSRLGELRATRVAAAVGKVFAVGFGIWGFLSFNMLLVLIAFFVFIGAESETRAVLVRALIGKLHVRDLMSPDVPAIPGEVSVLDAVERMLQQRRLSSYAADADGHTLGLITLDGVQRVPPEERAQRRAQEIAKPIPALSPNDEVGTALRLMGELDVPQLPVAESGHLIGTITRDDIARGLELSEFQSSQRRRRPMLRRRDEVRV
jgi:Zn-dependent protease